jgi:TonB family protein
MEALALYLLKSASWLAGFTLVFFLFLRNERFFKFNRLFLLAGILASFLLPFLTIHYYIDFPNIGDLSSGQPEATGIRNASGGKLVSLGFILSALYIAGAIFVTLMILIKSRSVLRSIKKSEIVSSDSVKLVRTDAFSSSFSFFSYVFVNPSVSDVETVEIVNHELGHIRQKHWVDLVLTELLCIIQWFNPLSWVYTRFIRQNHEYLADAEALQRSSDPAVYRATLLNQIVGAPLFTMANSFNYSLNKKRFKMMKNIISSPYRKIKALLILPVIAVILFAFAKPEYRLPDGIAGSAILPQAKVVKGTVVQQSGTPLKGATILVMGTTVGTSSDAKGFFKLENIQGDADLVVSYVGYKSKVLKPVFNADMVIKMVRDTFDVSRTLAPPPPPPPPPTTGYSTVSDMVPPPPPPPPASFNGINQPMIVIDGKITKVDLNTISPSTIESINVLKGESATKKYGDKAINGVLEITMKTEDNSGNQMNTYNQKSDKDIYVVVEEMPEFKGGNEALMKYMMENFKYPAEAAKKGITGKVMVTFVVTSTGKITDVKVEKPVDPQLDAEAVRLVSSMPDWKPAIQGGSTVDVYFKMPVDFKLK